MGIVCMLVLCLACIEHVVSVTPVRRLPQNGYNGEYKPQTESSGWKTCTSCKINNPESISQVKLEISDVRDNVDFHFGNFIKELKTHFSHIKEGVDNSYLPRLQKAFDSVIYKIENFKAQIKVNYTDTCDKFQGDISDIKRIDKRLKNTKTLVSEFVSNGTQSFLKIFKQLQNEFSGSSPRKTENDEPSKGPTNIKDGNIELKDVPPEAIIRTIESFLTDLTVEGNKLLDKVLFKT
ncbi:signal peptide containing protein [Theileria equi strain WA]|uniref:Signal peptide containing protein n=1 Tax=Theileria equi strain WA TaxID=1537102 RepID=L1LFI7_THEEQ|nr:signal peptide containing protein [Theileria equi strain WA]EKX74020.1 signal peptide containing protein [Theileria equi strain WA]|eukprot:XP_004833472.1 signal peptide containing protein [Theileria equi strain WA]